METEKLSVADEFFAKLEEEHAARRNSATDPTPAQIEILELIELLLNQVNKDTVYRHIRTKIGQHELFIEDTGVTVILQTKAMGTILDMERRGFGRPAVFHSFKKDKAAEMVVFLKQHYILDMLAGL